MSDLEKKFPYGTCECDGSSCCGGTGPAAFEVTRNDQRMKVCTRCDLSSDQDKKLLVKGSDDAETFMRFDPLGAFVIMGMMK